MAPTGSCGMHHLKRNGTRNLRHISRGDFLEAEQEVLLTLVDRCGTVGTSVLARAPQAGSDWNRVPSTAYPYR